MKNYKIVASDLDGTLLNSKSEVSIENLEAINKLIEKGVWFVPSTGRTLSEIPKEILNIQSIRYILHSNGAVVFDRKTGNKILNCIPNKTVRKLLDIFNSYDTHILYRTNGESFVDSAFQDDAAYEYYNVCQSHIDAIREFAVFSDEFKKVSYEADNVEVFSVFFHNYDDKINCMQILDQNKEIKYVEAVESNLEIMSADAGKGTALYHLADMLNIPYDETISMGDSDNDSSIITAAGLGLAMANSCEPLKLIADEIICSNDEHGVEYVLNHYFE